MSFISKIFPTFIYRKGSQPDIAINQVNENGKVSESNKTENNADNDPLLGSSQSNIKKGSSQVSTAVDICNESDKCKSSSESSMQPSSEKFVTDSSTSADVGTNLVLVRSLDSWNPETCVRLLRMPSVQNYTGLKKLIANSGKEWMMDFLELGGLEVLLESVDRLSSRRSSRGKLEHTFLLLQCVNCLKSVVNSQSVLEHIAAHKEYSAKLSRVLSSPNPLVKKQLFELMSALCVFSEDGHFLTLDVLEHHRVSRRLRYRFAVLLIEIKQAEVLPTVATVLYLINCIILGAGGFRLRTRIRSEFLALGLLDLMESLNQLSDEDVQLQCAVFAKSQMADEEHACSLGLKSSSSHFALYQALIDRVEDTPLSASFLVLLQNLNQIDPADPKSDYVWGVLEEVTDRALTSPGAVLRNWMLGEARCAQRKSRGSQTEETITTPPSHSASPCGSRCSRDDDEQSLVSVGSRDSGVLVSRSHSLSSNDVTIRSPSPIGNDCGESLMNQEKETDPGDGMEVDSKSKVSSGFFKALGLSLAFMKSSSRRGSQTEEEESPVSNDLPLPFPSSTHQLESKIAPVSCEIDCEDDLPKTKTSLSLNFSLPFLHKTKKYTLSKQPPPTVTIHPPSPELRRSTSCVLERSGLSSIEVKRSRKYSFFGATEKNNNASFQKSKKRSTFNPGICSEEEEEFGSSTPTSPLVESNPSPPDQSLQSQTPSVVIRHPPGRQNLCTDSRKTRPVSSPMPLTTSSASLDSILDNELLKCTTSSRQSSSSAASPTSTNVPVSHKKQVSSLSNSMTPSAVPPPPPPPPPSFNIPPPPPPPPPPPSLMEVEMKWDLSSSMLSLPVRPTRSSWPSQHPAPNDDGFGRPIHYTLPRPKSKMKTLNWAKIPSTQVNCQSIWREIHQDAKDIEVDFEQVEQLFCQKDTVTSNSGKRRPVSRQTSEVSLLDSKRSLSIGIFLKQFRSGLDELVDLVKNCRHQEVGAEKLRTLLQILPDANEIKLVKSYAGDKSQLGIAEKFILMLSEVEACDSRVEGMLLLEEFPSTAEQLHVQVQSLLDACAQLLNNDGLKDFLRIVLVTGNFMNSGSYAGNAVGFRLSTLPKLLETRANRPRITLLHYLVEEAEKKNKEMLSFTTVLLQHLSRCSRLTLDGLSGEIAHLAKGVRKLDSRIQQGDREMKKHFGVFVQHAKQQLSTLEKKIEEIRALSTHLAQRFCEDEKKFQVEECLTLLHSFCIRIKVAQAENQERRKAEEKMKINKPKTESRQEVKEKKEIKHRSSSVQKLKHLLQKGNRELNN